MKEKHALYVSDNFRSPARSSFGRNTLYNVCADLVAKIRVWCVPCKGG